MKISGAKLIDGAACAAELLGSLKDKRAHFEKLYGRRPYLVTVLVGDDPASAIYVRTKLAKAKEIGLDAERLSYKNSITESELLQQIETLNQDDTIDGILVQMPLPSHIDPHKVISALDPQKDVDGFHPLNVGRLVVGTPGLRSCTPKGCMKLLDWAGVSLTGMHAVIVGRSNIVGKPLAQMLLGADCTVTHVHSRSQNIKALCQQADLLAVAIGKPAYIRGDWVKPGAIVLDIGISRVIVPEGGSKLVGDVCFDEVSKVAAAMTPVPKGVGPMTVACLMENTIEAAAQRQGISLDRL